MYEFRGTSASGEPLSLKLYYIFRIKSKLTQAIWPLHLPYNPACKLHLPQSDRLLRFFSEYWAHRWDKGKLRFHGKALVPCEGFLRISFLPVIYFPYPDLLSWFDFQKTPATVLEKLSWSNLYCININKKGEKFILCCGRNADEICTEILSSEKVWL